MRYVLYLFLLATFLPSVVRAEGPAQAVSFRNAVAPILLERCQACHGPMKSSGSFRLDTFERLMHNSGSGHAVVPGKVAESDLYQLLIAQDKSQRMPKKSDPLSAEQIALIRLWIEQGAKFDGTDPKADLATLVPAKAQPEPPVNYRVAVPVLALAFSLDGKELVTGGYHEVLVWDATKGTLLRRINNIGQQVQGIAFNPDGSLLAVGSGAPGEYGELKTFDPKTGKLVRTYATSGDLILGVAFSPDGQMLASAGADRTLRVYQVADGKELCRVRQHADFVTGVAFNRDSTSVAGCSRDRMVKVFEPRTGKLQATYVGHPNKVFAIAFDTDSNRICSAGEERRIHVWNPREVAAADGTAAQMEDRFKKELPAKHIPGFDKEIVALSVQGGSVYSAVGASVRQHDLTSLKLIREFIGLSDSACAVAVHGPTKRLAASGFDGRVCIWDAEGSARLTFIAAPGQAKPAVLTPTPGSGR